MWTFLLLKSSIKFQPAGEGGRSWVKVSPNTWAAFLAVCRYESEGAPTPLYKVRKLTIKSLQAPLNPTPRLLQQRSRHFLLSDCLRGWSLRAGFT